jgi:hypothetical protein
MGGRTTAPRYAGLPSYRKFLTNGQPTEPVPLALRDLPPIDDSHSDALIARSRNERSRPREGVEAMLERFLGGKTRKTPTTYRKSWS